MPRCTKCSSLLAKLTKLRRFYIHIPPPPTSHRFLHLFNSSKTCCVSAFRQWTEQAATRTPTARRPKQQQAPPQQRLRQQQKLKTPTPAMLTRRRARPPGNGEPSARRPRLSQAWLGSAFWFTCLQETAGEGPLAQGGPPRPCCYLRDTPLRSNKGCNGCIALSGKMSPHLHTSALLEYYKSMPRPQQRCPKRAHETPQLTGIKPIMPLAAAMLPS